jgi:prephenate dehydratase
MRVAYQGEAGAFSEEAVLAFLGADAVPVPHYDFAAVAEAVRQGSAERGVLPVENSIHGSVTAAWDVLVAGDLTVLAQLIRPIRLCVAAVPGATLAAVRRVISHPVALSQCQRFLRQLEGVDAVATHDTAGAAREVAAAADITVAAISSRSAAARYGLDVLVEDVQDRPDNQTRFLLIGRASKEDVMKAVDAGRQRMLLLVELADRPGALVDVLMPFKAHGINLSSIHSRPAGEPWAYRFFIEVSAPIGPAAPRRAALGAALDEVRQCATRVVLLGCFD